MRIIDTSDTMLSCFDEKGFNLSRWESYMDAHIPGAKQLCLEDMQNTLCAGYTWDKDYLPVLNGVSRDERRREEAICSFRVVTRELESRILSAFGKNVDADIVLYLGLCCGAGWVTEINGRVTVLLGIEKIIELEWCGVDHMNGLILHELGHVFQAQHGVLQRELHTNRERFLWQLFTEGIAMVFEQEVAGDRNYFHQDKEGWLLWCRENECRIAIAFARDLDTMTREDQRYFGDWVRFEGMPDTGYYLGTCLVRNMMRTESFDRLITCNVDAVERHYNAYLSRFS